MTGVPHKGEYLNTTFPIMQALAPFLIREVAAGSSSLSLACLFMVNCILTEAVYKKSASSAIIACLHVLALICESVCFCV